MGQNSSTLKETRTTDENDQLPTGKKRFSKRMKLSKEVMPPTAECAASLLGTIESADFSLRETFRKVLHINRRRAVHAPNALLSLPTELILGIAKDLSPSNYMSLSYSCRTIRKKMGASRAHVLGDKVPKGQPPGSTLSVEIRNIRYLERWELRCMLDRDAEILLSKASRGGRKKTDDGCTQSVSRLPRLTTKHRLSGSAGEVWICPIRTVKFHQAKSPLKEGHYAIRCGGTRSTMMDFPMIQCKTFVMHWPIIKTPPNCVPSNEAVKEALGPLNAPVCPHLRLNSACIASGYDQDSPRQQWKFHRGGFGQAFQCYVMCNFCGATIYFSIYEQFRGSGNSLNLVIVRRFTGIRSCTDRGWICQVADPADFNQYAEAWRSTVAEC